MKKRLLIVLFGMFSFLFIACDSDKISPNIDGKWSDNIKLSQKTAVFDSNLNTITITTAYDSWWLGGIALNQEKVDLTNVNMLEKNFVVTNAEFQVERKNGKTIVITMNKNVSGVERVLSISLQNGDYFDGINVTQRK